jgi:hypothetical protein
MDRHASDLRWGMQHRGAKAKQFATALPYFARQVNLPAGQHGKAHPPLDASLPQ